MKKERKREQKPLTPKIDITTVTCDKSIVFACIWCHEELRAGNFFLSDRFCLMSLEVIENQLSFLIIIFNSKHKSKGNEILLLYCLVD